MTNKIPLGKPLELSEDDLKKLTSIEEIKKIQKEADKLWRKAVDPELADLLYAREMAE